MPKAVVPNDDFPPLELDPLHPAHTKPRVGAAGQGEEAAKLLVGRTVVRDYVGLR